MGESLFAPVKTLNRVQAFVSLHLHIPWLWKELAGRWEPRCFCDLTSSTLLSRTSCSLLRLPSPPEIADALSSMEGPLSISAGLSHRPLKPSTAKTKFFVFSALPPNLLPSRPFLVAPPAKRKPPTAGPGQPGPPAGLPASALPSGPSFLLL